MSLLLHHNCFNRLFSKKLILSNAQRYHAHDSANEVPIIKIPKYLEDNLGNSIYKEHVKVNKNEKKWHKAKLDQQHVHKLIISSSGDKRLNHYYGFRYEVDKVPLISKEWMRQQRTIGEQMTFHKFDSNPSILQFLKDEDKSFKSLGLNDHIISSIYQLVNNGKYINPSAIQFGVIPFILQNKNVILSAETGSGKTIAYLAPLIQMIEEERKTIRRARMAPLGLIILPSRELTEQVGRVARELAASTGVGVATIIGGIPKNISNTGTFDLVITTIGMIESHLSRGIYKLDQLSHIVLDEADTLLDDTFSVEVLDLLGGLNINSKSPSEQSQPEGEVDLGGPGVQLICASATMPSTLDSTIGTLLNMSEEIEKVTTKNLHTIHPNVKHVFHRTKPTENDLKIIELLKEDMKKKRCTLIFVNRSIAASWLFKYLNGNDIPCVRLCAGMTEEERLHSFNSFQSGEYDILVATDLGSRGLDTSRVNHVINYNCPNYVSDYIHRAGRTGRLSSEHNSCLVTTLVSYRLDIYMLMELEKAIRLGGEIKCTDANVKAQIRQRRTDKKNKMQRNFQ